MKIPLTLLILALLTVALAAVSTATNNRVRSEDSSVMVEPVCQEFCDQDGNMPVGDPLPMTVLAELEPEVDLDPFPTKKHLQMVGRIADGVTKKKMKEGGWWECGIFYTEEEEIREMAMTYAYHIVKEAWEVSDPPYMEDGWHLNVWGVVGTIWNESKFDRCAFGLHPRVAAYEMGLLKQNRLTLSHKEEDVLRAVRSEKLQNFFKKSGFDLGVGQLLSRFYPNPKDYKYMLSLQGGTVETMRSMRYRASLYKTDRPWRYWPGHRSFDYDKKITRWARMLGATEDEI